MPAARAICYKSGLAPANTLSAFRFPDCRSGSAQAGIPIAFPYSAATHIVQATHANAKTKAYPNVSSRFSGRVSLPQSIVNYEDFGKPVPKAIGTKAMLTPMKTSGQAPRINII